ncbi:MAG: asparagine synthase-related protein [Sulfurovum sp.]|nr:asparagine synthase-related protein [Sulfurovum sp.]
MSAFFFLMHRDGTAPSAYTIDRLYSKTASWPHDQEKLFVHDNVAAGQATQWISELDKKTALPISIEINGNSYLFTGNVRLDNRSELIKQLNITENDPDNAELIIRAYLKWGEEKFADRLLGDFSFALYDALNQTLLCVRDHMGVRPLYYHANDSFFLVSDSIEVILSHPEVSQTLNDTVVAEFALKGWVFNQQETFFTSIQKCPRATCLKVTKEGMVSNEYWDIKEIKPLQYDTEEEYVKHLKELIETVIADRIDSAYPISAHMSGGLDSSVIATIAGRMWKAKGNETFHTYNWCRPGPDDDLNWHEWGDARKIAEIEGFEHSEIDCNAEEIKKTLLTHDIRTDGTTMYEYERVLLPQAEAKRVRVILSGFGGDEILTARFRDTHIDKIRKGRFIAAWKALKNELPKNKKLNSLRLPYRYIKLVNKSIRPDRLRRKKDSENAEKIASMSLPMLKSDFAHFAHASHTNLFASFRESIIEKQHFYINLGYHQERLESWTALGRKAGVRYVYPYLDKRIVEFALSIPSSLYVKGGQSHYLYQQAILQYLPSFLQNKIKPSEKYRVKKFFHEIYKAMIDDNIKSMIDKFDSPYIDKEKYLKQHYETTRKFDKIENVEELMVIDKLKSLFLIKKCHNI